MKNLLDIKWQDSLMCASEWFLTRFCTRPSLSELERGRQAPPAKLPSDRPEQPEETVRHAWSNASLIPLTGSRASLSDACPCFLRPFWIWYKCWMKRTKGGYVNGSREKSSMTTIGRKTQQAVYKKWKYAHGSCLLYTVNSTTWIYNILDKITNPQVL